MQTTGLAEAPIGELYERQRLADALREVRERTLAYYGHLDLPRLAIPRISTVNLPLWELAHIAWFQEFWCLRGGVRAEQGAIAPSLLDDADAMFDSSRVPHASRWSLPYPPEARLRDYMAATLESTLRRLPAMSAADLYFAHLALTHEDMHGEALLMTLQQLGLPAPAIGAGDACRAAGPAVDVSFDGGGMDLGTPQGSHRFVFDNESGAHRIEVAPFAISSEPVTHGDFVEFVESGGYENPACWDDEGRAWRAANARHAPRFWFREGGGWHRARFGVSVPVDPSQAMLHVNLHEARAWCAWKHRRLPSEAEWEFAARHHGGRLHALHGCVWQWTASAFAPYPGFAPGPYRDYSQPWFHSHFVLRGGSFATRERIATPSYRNFYLPHRDDVFAGFRTCAVRSDRGVS